MKTDQTSNLSSLLVNPSRPAAGYREEVEGMRIQRIIERGGTVAFLGRDEIRSKVLKGLSGDHLSDDRDYLPAVMILSLDMSVEAAYNLNLQQRKEICEKEWGIPWEIMSYHPPMPLFDRSGGKKSTPYTYAVKPLVESLQPGQEVPSLRREVEMHRIDRLYKMAQELSGSGKMRYVEALKRASERFDLIKQELDSYEDFRRMSPTTPERSSIHGASFVILSHQSRDDPIEPEAWQRTPHQLKIKSTEHADFRREADSAIEGFRQGGSPLRVG